MKDQNAGPVCCSVWILMKALACEDGGGHPAASPSHHPEPEAFTMRCFQPPAGTRFYAGVDLHARAIFVVVLDHGGRVVFAKNLPAAPNRSYAPPCLSATA